MATRFEIRSQHLSNRSALPEIFRGEYVADPVAIIGSLDTITGEVDR